MFDQLVIIVAPPTKDNAIADGDDQPRDLTVESARIRDTFRNTSSQMCSLVGEELRVRCSQSFLRQTCAKQKDCNYYARRIELV